MIKYNKAIFGLNLLWRVHGSPIYRTVLPATLSLGVFLIFRMVWDRPPKSVLLHPYAAGVLIGGITFLLVFRVTQSYGRYWEATGSVYKMQSKWMDATIHISNYHMQSSNYDKIRPPKFSEHHYLNEHRLTRDRERVRSSRSALGTSGKISIQRAQKKSIEHVNVDVGGGIPKLIGMTPSEEDSAMTPSLEFGVIPVLHNMVEKVGERAPKRQIGRRISSRRFESAFKSSEMSLDSDDDDDDENILMSRTRPPKFLTGRPKTDGNWGSLFEDGNSTYLEPDNPSEIDTNGFASIQGGRTPILFLQELAHLSSLMNAVALSSLRNDSEGVSSPLSLYIPGSAWPAVDPKWDKNLYDTSLEASFYAILYFLGQGRSPSERAKYNVARPLPVLGGVSDAEIQMLQMSRGPLAKTQLCWGWMSELAVREFDEHGALLSRCMQFMSDGMMAYNDCRKIMFNPFPFPFAQISSFFVNFMWLLVPLMMDQYVAEDWLGALVTFVSVMCLQSIDEVAKELENPFRNIPNELPVVTYQAEYNEALLTMYSGFHPDAFWKPPRDCRRSTFLANSSSFLGKSATFLGNSNNEDMKIIKESSSHGESVSEVSEKTCQTKEDAKDDAGDDAGGHEKMNAKLLLIVEQQRQMMEQMMNEQKKLNSTLEKMLVQNNHKDD